MVLATAADDPMLEAVAAMPFGQALRAAGCQRAAFETAITAAQKVAPLTDDSGTAAERAACAALLVQAALRSATLPGHLGCYWTPTGSRRRRYRYGQPVERCWPRCWPGHHPRTHAWWR
ncbi:hypothetical protein ID554_13255 [Micromonospora craniellae]|uniref:hypothetical protein n=1 Tax=Micromonospora craniellae TaxID=2294034 RepID=UPI00168C0481|nr:hypothetical protein ID554_13255 [Micromonospora craniellae]